MKFLYFIISSGLLIGLVLLARIKFRSKLAPSVIYAMWLIPLLRLLVPFGTWETPVFGIAADVMNAPYYLISEWISGDAGIESELHAIEAYPEVQIPEKGVPVADFNHEVEKIDPEILETAVENGNKKVSDQVTEDTFPVVTPELFVASIWLTGSLGIGFYVFLRNRQLKKVVSAMKRTADAKDLMICISDKIGVPCLVGVIKPKILIPERILQDPELYECALGHERAHYQQKDHIWTAVRILICIVYWWNPLVWIGAKCVEEDAELACDARVLKGQTPEGRKKYGYALLQILSTAQGDNYRMCIATSLAGSKKSMKMRIQEIANGTVTKRGVLLPLLLAMLVVLVMGCAAPTQKSWIKTADWETGETEDATYTEAEYGYVVQNDINSMLLYCEVYKYGELMERSVLSYGNLYEKNSTMKFRRESAIFEEKQTLSIDANGIGTVIDTPASQYANGAHAGGALQSENGKIEITSGTDLILLSDYYAEGEEGMTLYNCDQLSECTGEEIKELIKNNYIVSFVRVIFSDKRSEDLYQSFKQREYPTGEEFSAEHQFATAWADAFADRNAEALVTMATAETLQILIDQELMEENLKGFGFSSPWPMFTEPCYQIVNCDSNGVEILYYASDSTPHVAVWREELKFSQNDDEILVSSWKMEWYDSIENVEDFYAAYPEGKIVGTVMDYSMNGLGAALNKNALENTASGIYQPLFQVESAAVSLLNISTDSKKVDYSTEDVGGEATVQIRFLNDGGSEDVVEVLMWQPFGEDAIWIPKEIIGIDRVTVEGHIDTAQITEVSAPSKEEILAMRKIVLEGMTEEEVERLTENIKIANLRLESAYLYDDIFEKLSDKESLYWNYFDQKGDIQIGWSYDGDYSERKTIITEEGLSESEFYVKYGTPVMEYNRFDAANFINLIQEMQATVHNDKLIEDLQKLIDLTSLATETHEMKYANAIYKILHDLDYFLLRYGIEDVGKYTSDNGTVSKYYGVLDVYGATALADSDS